MLCLLLRSIYNAFTVKVIIIFYSICGLIVSYGWSDQMGWREVGPGGGGVVQDFAFDPIDHNRVYLTSDMVGVFVSDDAGEHWRWSSYGAAKQQGGIAVDPTDANSLYVVGPEGIFQTNNKGKYWQLIYSKGNGFNGINNESFGPLRGSIFGAPGRSISISSKGVVYVCTEVGDVIISRDKGRSWNSVSTGGNSPVINVIPIDEKNMVAALYKEGIFLSRDEGLTWNKMLSSSPGNLLALAIHPVKRNVLYALISKEPISVADEYASFQLPAYLFKSINGGSEWEMVHKFEGLSIKKRQRRRMDISSEGTIIILTARWPIRSTDGGRTWESSSLEGRKDDGVIYHTMKGLALGPQSIYIDPIKPGRWYMTNMLAAFRSDDDGKTWDYKVEGLREQAYWFVKINPNNPNIVIASDLDHGLITSSDLGSTWRNVIIEDPFEECDQMRFSPNNDTYKILYAFYNHPYPFIAKSTDAGETWRILKRWKDKARMSMNGFSLTEGSEFPVMYVGEPNVGIWKSIDNGENWAKKNKGLPRPGEITYIQFLESDKRGYLYVGIATETKGGHGGIFSSKDGGESWFPINHGLQSPFVRRKSFEIDPNNPDILWVGAGNAVYRSSNAGMTWEKRIGNMLASAILVEPGNSDNVYVASYTGGGILEQYNAGIYKSVDGGNYFFKISGDLFRTIGSSYRVSDLEYGWRGSGGIWAAPDGGGLIYTIPPFAR